ncbi:MAG TPA: cytochrome c oxidase subunit 3 [Thermomicrobiales bacterium]|nr:cytochrome c oxidase subunit 3 [Thermomicrobiales bacterium]
MAQTVELTHASGGAGHDLAGHGGGDHSSHTATGVNSRKLLMWLFLASDCMFFGALIATFMIYRGKTEALAHEGVGKGPFPSDLIDIPFTSVSAFILLMSSLTMVLALAALQKNDIRGSRIWLASTAILGTAFLGGQFFEFSDFHHQGLSLQTNLFGSTFFTLTGFHGLHVGIGVLWLTTLLFVSLRGGLTSKDSMSLEVAGLYWHFVDIVWIIIFTLVYLLPYEDMSEFSSGEAASHVVQFGRTALGVFF